MSKPETISGFKLEASANCGYKIAGRKLAKRLSSLRIFNKPRSGRIERSMLSHFGPPTAPSKMASAFFACSAVCSGYGEP